MRPAARLILVISLALSLVACLLVPLAGVGGGPTPTPTLCPQATPEPLWVEPVRSPTDAQTQTIVVFLGNGEEVVVSHETGVFTQTGTFDAYNNPARVEVDLEPGRIHHLAVTGRVRKVQSWGCPYGGYTLTTLVDRDGGPLTIVQSGGP